MIDPGVCNGPTGPTGSGAQGPQGPQGAQGPQGPQGAQGATGINNTMLGVAFGGTTVLTGTGMNFLGMYDDNVQANEVRGQMVIPNTWTVKVQYGIHGTANSASDETYVGRVNGVNTSLSITILQNTTSANLTGQSVSVAPGDKFSTSITSSVSNTQVIQARVSYAGAPS